MIFVLTTFVAFALLGHVTKAEERVEDGVDGWKRVVILDGGDDVGDVGSVGRRVRVERREVGKVIFEDEAFGVEEVRKLVGVDESGDEDGFGESGIIVNDGKSGHRREDTVAVEDVFKRALKHKEDVADSWKKRLKKSQKAVGDIGDVVNHEVVTDFTAGESVFGRRKREDDGDDSGQTTIKELNDLRRASRRIDGDGLEVKEWEDGEGERTNQFASVKQQSDSGDVNKDVVVGRRARGKRKEGWNSTVLGDEVFAEDEDSDRDAVERLVEVYAPRSREVAERCRNDSELYLEAVRRGEVWAAKMVDASSKWPEGLLTGSLVQLGNYDECLAAKSPRFAGQLCMATLDGVATLLARSDTPVARYLEAGKTTEATWSVCVPDTCTSSDVHGHLEHVIDRLATSHNASRLKVTSVTCLSKATLPKFSALDWGAVGVLALLAALVATSTVYDVLTKHSVHRHSLLTAFSAYSNGRVLLSPAKDSLPALHGVRMFNRIWDNLGQRYTRPMLSPAVNADKLDEYYSDWPHIFIANFSNSIDTIFFLSGLLVAYNFMKERHKGTTFYLLVFYLQRYIRFTPPFAMVMLLTSSLFRHAGDGPLWDARTQPNQERCLDNWWLGFIYLNNYINKDRQCLDQSWFNAAEMQLFWLCPLILIPLWRYPRYGKAFLSFLIAIGVVIRFIVAYVHEVPVDLPGPAGKGRLLYWPTHTRYVPWFVGLGLGYLLHQAEHEPPIMSRGQVTLGWTLSVICLVAPSLLAKPFMQPDHEYNRFFDSLYLSLFRPSFSFGLAWLVYACITGYGGVVNKFLSWSFFRVLSRTMYSFYLSHVSVMQLTAASLRHPIYVDDTYAVTRWIGGFVISVFTSSMLCLVCEMPFVFMEQHFLGKIGHKPEKKRRNTPDIIVTGKEEGKPAEGGAAGEGVPVTMAAVESNKESSTESFRTAELNGFDLDNGTVCSMSDQDWADWAEDKMRNTAEMVMSEEQGEEEESLELHLHPAPPDVPEDGDDLRETLEVLMQNCEAEDEDDFLVPGNFIF